MLNLTGNQRIRVTTETICNVWASYVDKDGSTFTPDNNSGVITVAATIATIVAEPTGSIIRNVKSINVQETTGAKCTVEVIIYDGVDTFEIFNGTIGPYGRLVFDDEGNWTITQGISVSQTIYNTGSGTYTVPDGVGMIFVECVDGGGGGGGCLDAATNSAAAGGGGAGAYCAKYFPAAAGGSYAYAVGAAGTGAAAGNNNGNAGGTTTFGGVLSAPGGSGGLADTVATIHVGGKGGAGGTPASGGDINVDGAPGETGMALAAAQAVSGRGGSSAFGGGGNCIKNTTTAGVAGSGYGSGGSGGCIISSGGDTGGGDGVIGLIVITEYYS